MIACLLLRWMHRCMLCVTLKRTFYPSADDLGAANIVPDTARLIRSRYTIVVGGSA